jgi:hypothetical protein
VAAVLLHRVIPAVLEVVVPVEITPGQAVAVVQEDLDSVLIHSQAVMAGLAYHRQLLAHRHIEPAVAVDIAAAVGLVL